MAVSLGEVALIARVTPAAIPATSPNRLLMANDHVRVTHLDHSTRCQVWGTGPSSWNPCYSRNGALGAELCSSVGP